MVEEKDDDENDEEDDDDKEVEDDDDDVEVVVVVEVSSLTSDLGVTVTSHPSCKPSASIAQQGSKQTPSNVVRPFIVPSLPSWPADSDDDEVEGGDDDDVFEGGD